jgi:two-component system CheB/CheR fusion protein
VGEFTDLFCTLDRKLKLYQRKENIHSIHRPVVGRLLPTMTEASAVPRAAGTAPRDSKLSLREITERELLQQYAPVAVLVNEQGEMLYLHGRTGQYLEPATGESGVNILKMAREGLRRDLTTALHNAAARREPVRHLGLRVKTNGDFTSVNLAVRPVTPSPDATAQPNLFLVIFEEVPAVDQQRSEKAAAVNAGEGADETAMDVDVRFATLKRELRAKEEYLQTTNEELETTNEELKSSNEEMQSVNEELQSTNEELETSKEELQSVNEELATVNAELQTKVADLSRANNDMNNLLAGTGIGTIFVDHQLRIVRFTPPITRVISLILSDVGRPVGQIVSNLVGYDRLVPDVRAVLDTLAPKEIEVQTQAGEWYILRIRPYRTLENVIEGAVITFVDISEMKRVQEALREANALCRLAVVVRDGHDAISVQDLKGRILAWNPGAERMYGWSEVEALAMNVRDRIPESRRTEELAIVQRLGRGDVLEPYCTQRVAKDGQTLEVWVTATGLTNEAGQVYAVATTERKRQT